MKTKYPIEKIDLRHQSEQKTPKKVQLFNYFMNMILILIMLDSLINYSVEEEQN